MNYNIFGTLVLEQNPNYVNDLEAKYNMQLPPIFKAFVQTFEFGKMNPSPQHKIIHPNNELGYNGFEHSLEKKIKIYNDPDFEYKDLGILPIIPSGIYQNGICVGLEKEKKDAIYLYVNGVSEVLRLIAPNFLQFISEFKEIHWDNV